jgi:hypothetical protein
LPACKPQTNNAPIPPQAVVNSLEPLLNTLPIKKPVVEEMPDTTTSVAFDTLLHYYKETYKVTLLKNEVGLFGEDNNALLIITRQSDKKQVVRDSLYSQWDDVRFEDYNDDGYKDVLVSHESSARSNQTYYLYATSFKSKTFRRIKDFETEVLNPSIDSNKIVNSYVLVGALVTDNFYKLSNYKLIDLGKSESEPSGEYDNEGYIQDSIAYTKAYAKALKLAKKYK